MTQLVWKQWFRWVWVLACSGGWVAVRADEPAASQPKKGQVIEGIVVNHLGGGIVGAKVRLEALDASEDDSPLASAITGATGDIRIELPEHLEGTVRARVIKEGYATFVQEIDLSAENQIPWIDATLDGAGKVTGVVRDRLFNEPVKGALVACQTGGQNFNATTDGEGRYSFNSVGQGPVSMRVTANGFGLEQISFRMESDETEQDFELGPERKIELRLITDDEKPAADVTVEAIPLPTNGYVSAKSGADGRVALSGIPEAAEALILRLNGQRYIQMRGYDVRVDIAPEARAGDESHPPPTSMPAVRRELVVHVAATLKGKVTDAKTNQPIVGVRVIAGREFSSDAPMAWSSLDGSYELPGLPPGLTVVAYQHGQYATAIEELHLDMEQTATKDVALEEGQTLAGRVVDGNGEPVEQVHIAAEEWKGYSTLGLRAVTDKDGAFSFPNAPSGEIKFSFVKPGLGPPVEQNLTAGKDNYKIVLTTGEEEADNTPPTHRRTGKVEVGKLVPDMTLIALDGTTYKLSQLRGKYVFLDVWATWCGPCIGEVPNVKALHEAMEKRSDFVLIGISLDTDREALKAAMQQRGIDWPQVFGPKSGAREAFEMLNGVAIPSTSLIGPDGTLLAQDLRGPGLTEAVKAAMKKAPASRPAAGAETGSEK